jgi:CheY-like chemotaxis protein
MKPGQARLRPVLVIDDSDDDMCLLRHTLTKAGVENPLVSFEDSIEARRYLQSAINPPNLALLPCIVFTDLKMPRLNGIELIAWARSNPHYNPVRFVMLSTSQNEHDQEASRQAGADDYLIKFPPPEVFASLICQANTFPRRTSAQS